MKTWFIVVAMLALSPLINGDNRRLVAEKVKELEEINRQVLEQIKDLKKYNNRDIYVKVKIVDRGDGKMTATIEQISVDRIKTDIADTSTRVVYLKGKVKKNSDDSKFKLDLEHVLPDDDDSKTDNGKSKTEGERK